MTLEALWERYPQVYHMTALGTWASIRNRGLLSTSALLDLFEVTGEDRLRIEARRRPETVRLSHPIHGTVTIRDQKPLHDSMLARCLRGCMNVEQWHRLLNSRAFFWVDPGRLETLRNAREYRDERQTVIFASTRPLAERYASSIRLAHINTGATRSVMHYRDQSTFKAIQDYERRRIVELTVDHSIPDVVNFVTRVEDIGGGQDPEVVWTPS